VSGGLNLDSNSVVPNLNFGEGSLGLSRPGLSLGGAGEAQAPAKSPKGSGDGDSWRGRGEGAGEYKGSPHSGPEFGRESGGESGARFRSEFGAGGGEEGRKSTERGSLDLNLGLDLRPVATTYFHSAGKDGDGGAGAAAAGAAGAVPVVYQRLWGRVVMRGQGRRELLGMLIV